MLSLFNDEWCLFFFLALSSVTSVKVQEPAPQFEGKAIIDGQIKDIKLSDFAGKYLVLFFYPLDL